MDKKEAYDILIVDDSVAITALVTRWLNDQGYTSMAATSSAEALQLFEDVKFSLAILDIVMPGMSGITLAKHIRDKDKFLPIIFATAIDDARIIKTAIDFGAYGFMVKPINKNELISNIYNAFKRGKLEKESSLHKQDLKNMIAIRTEELQAERDGIKDALSAISVAMKEVLTDQDFDVRMANPDLKVCSDIMGCNNNSCPCYGQKNIRCWQIAGTFCGGIPQGHFVEKYEKCSECPVLKSATTNYKLELGEHFNNMMNLLAIKHNDLIKAYDILKKSKIQIDKQ